MDGWMEGEGTEDSADAILEIMAGSNPWTLFQGGVTKSEDVKWLADQRIGLVVNATTNLPELAWLGRSSGLGLEWVRMPVWRGLHSEADSLERLRPLFQKVGKREQKCDRC